MKSRTILLIDSDLDSQTIYSLILTHHGFRVVCAADGERGFQMALQERPNLIVIDPFTTRAEGREVVDLLRLSEHTSHLPLVVLTSAPSLLPRIVPPGSRSERYLVKPCQPRVLLQEVESVLEPGLSVTA